MSKKTRDKLNMVFVVADVIGQDIMFDKAMATYDSLHFNKKELAWTLKGSQATFDVVFTTVRSRFGKSGLLVVMYAPATDVMLALIVPADMTLDPYLMICTGTGGIPIDWSSMNMFYWLESVAKKNTVVKTVTLSPIGDTVKKEWVIRAVPDYVKQAIFVTKGATA